MIIGCLGDIVFQVSAETVKTLNKLKWSGSATWATHARHGYHALTEFTGIDPDQISFEIYLSTALGVKPMDTINTIWEYERNGAPQGLVIGDKAYGKYRWAITKHTTSAEQYDGRGNVIAARVNLSLLEYLNK